MLNAQELETSPLFRNITYEEYRRRDPIWRKN